MALRTLATTLVGCGFVFLAEVHAQAQGFATPRPGLRPSFQDMLPLDDTIRGGNGRIDSLTMPPQATIPITPADQIRVQNIGTVELSFSYWDAEPQGAWRTLKVGSGQTTALACPKCGPMVTISFHNGKENKVVPIPMGNSYVLRWLPQQDVWDIAPLNQQALGLSPRT